MNRSTILTPEMIEMMAKEAETIRTQGERIESTRRPNGSISPVEIAVPDLIKFKFVLCDVEINNINAAAEE